MKTTRIMFLAGALTLALSGVATAHRADASASTTLTLRHTRLGSILVAPDGHTLYEFTRDRSNVDNCQTIKGCTSVWPPLTASGSPKASGGVNAHLLGTIKLKNGTHQVTYAGHPLYLYAADDGPGQTEYVGADEAGGIWYALNAHGGAVK